ncbi:aryl-sulfate sulfotransferase, partial [Patescibacteria group bacterium]|nr:aryl-sulfate sulfotransferase [Patescibacteria group bacterium]
MRKALHSRVGLGILAGLVILLSCAAGVFVYRSFLQYCADLKGTGIVTYIDDAAVQDGYILVAPNYADKFFNEPGKVQLINTKGVVVHEWKTPYTPMYATLEADGSIYVEMTPPADIVATPGGGKTGLIQRISWDGVVLWEYTDETMHHDFEVLPNGSVAFLSWVAMPNKDAVRVVGGSHSSLATSSTVWVDAIVVVNENKEVVWKWNLFDHIDPAEYPLNSFTPFTDWSHANSVRYIADNSLTHTPAFLISVRHISRILLVDAQSGDIIWMSPKGMTSFQHDATMLDNGNILTFDNGLFRPQDRPYLWSRVLEIDPRTNKITWQYKGG